MLLCPVRNCHNGLVRYDRRFVCEQGHSFDVAQSGYVNLLQPQERRSKTPGDSKAVVAARRRLHERRVSEPLLRAMMQVLTPNANDTVLDAGCGDGFYLGSMARETGFAGCGIDISIPAIDAAARRYPGSQWIVANADRFVPYANESFSIVLSITARMNSAEFRRVLKGDGRLLVAIPAPDDLIELRGAGRDRVPQTLQTFSSEFSLDQQRRITGTAELDGEAVHDAFLSIYRPIQLQPAEGKRVTISLDLLLFVPR